MVILEVPVVGVVLTARRTSAVMAMGRTSYKE
jgi:hypothetical protein